jgi:hypothetical protein
MKKIIFLLTFTLTVSIGKTQSSKLFLLNDMINKCLDECLNYCLTQPHYPIPSLLIDYYSFGFEFSDSVKSRQLDYVSIRNPKFYKYLRKEQYVLFFDGLFLNCNKLTFQFSGRFVQYEKKKRNLNIAISDWFRFVYEYSCDKKEWILVEKDFGGI